MLYRLMHTFTTIYTQLAPFSVQYPRLYTVIIYIDGSCTNNIIMTNAVIRVKHKYK